MALALTLQTSGGDATAGTTATTASVTTAAGELWLVDVWGDLASSGSPAPPTGISGAGLTFAQENQVDGDANFLNLSRFRAEASGASSGALTITFGASQAEIVWIVYKVTGQQAGSNGANAFNSNKVATGNAGSGTTQSATLAALASANNAALAAFAWENAAGPTILTGTPGNSFTEIGDTGIAQATIYSEGLCNMFRINAVNPAVTWSTTATNRSVIADELIADTGGADGLRGQNCL